MARFILIKEIWLVLNSRDQSGTTMAAFMGFDTSAVRPKRVYLFLQIKLKFSVSKPKRLRQSRRLATKAASAVQAVSRKLLAQRKALKERNSKVWNKLDNLNEQLAIRRSMQLQTLFGSEDQVTTSDGASLDIQIEDDYEGPHLDFNKLTLDQVLDMLEHFKQGRILHIKYGFEILSRTKKMLAAEP
eukprot:CAMPEP_0194745942 /NCGR_PEP_ID=MMETSP0296-20130528/101680_1 /TAXON_ID=39354 /ORGANISM="Heterosigma akashiwo, Strain CCMP2393" /LENGTH=186 /DNA_ID=CAMNT_0039658203 /DNA_START=131 /DNA_END=687 /DNA_ORIENTATION=-